MNPPADRPAEAAWTSHRERSNLGMMRAMRWVSLNVGRRVSRAFLHPISLYFVIAGGEVRRHSRRYLGRALGRTARWTDVYRHIHHFSSTVLDRVYFLQGRFDKFEIRSPGIDLVDQVLEAGQGAFLIGAHLGSFEALRAIGHGRGEKVAMVMYEDNARLINATLAAIAPHAMLKTIALGRLDAMLTLRQWLDSGGVAGVLADRILPVASARSKIVSLPFLGRPARFSDGPFRLAALLRQPVVFMAGLYDGGRRYELRFQMLADFSRRPASGAELEASIQEAMKRYVELLESLCRETPYNWFNFFDFWGEDTAP